MLTESSSQKVLVNFIYELRYAEALESISEVVINKLHQPWRTFLSIINKCLTAKSSCVDRAREPMVQILWGLFNNANVDYANLIWEDSSWESSDDEKTESDDSDKGHDQTRSFGILVHDKEKEKPTI
ncbi:hypothetical protein Tco_1011894 [Tanacetum coccineum]